MSSASGSVGVLASGATGLEVAGTLGGIVGTLVAVVALTLSVLASNRKKRRDYDADIRDAEARGEKRKQDELTHAYTELDFWRARAMGGSGPVPVYRPQPPIRPLPPRGAGDEDVEFQ